ncbi:fructosamine kinase FrlD [Niallia sp. NCCP-28]|nr:fructosamine kinase FrlD [Niallia sp. NCCP-28]
MKIIGIGDSVVDFYKHEGLIYPGGNAVNVIVSAKRNGAKESAYLGIVGNDGEGKHILESLNSENIDISRVRKVYGPTGEAIISLTEDGDRQFIGTNRAVRVQSLLSLRLNQEDMDFIDAYDLIHTSINSDLENELPKLAHKDISFDFSTTDRWNNDYLEKVCPFIHYAFFSGSDMSLKEIYELIEQVHDYGVEIVGITRGEDNAVFSRNGKIYKQNPLPTKLVDTMGAGDSFIGGFLAAYHEGKDMEHALYVAAQSAAMTCECSGAFGYGKKKEESNKIVL